MVAVKARWRRLRPRLLSRIVYWVARLLCGSIRLSVQGEESMDSAGRGTIVCTWHGRSLIPAYHLRGRGIWALFSLSNDGELQSRFFGHMGYRMIRGSTGRGGDRAAIEAIRILRQGGCLALTPDGPRGPAGVLQDGILVMAKKSGAAIVPMGVSANRRWLIRTWDRYLIPKPFARAVLRFGSPIFVPADADAATLEAIRTEVAGAIDRLQNEAEASFR